MPIINPHVLIVDDTQYDLQKVVSWWTDDLDPDFVQVRFQHVPDNSVRINKVAFEAQMQLNVDYP